MFYASDIIGKKVISLYESEFIGTVCNIYYNKKRTKVVVFEIFNNEETRMFLNVHDIFNIGQAISIKSKFNLIPENEFDITSVFKSIVNKHIYSELGNFFGKISDIILTDKFEIQNVIALKNNINIIDEYNFLTNDSSVNLLSTSKKHETYNDTLISSLSMKDFIRFGNILIISEGAKHIKFSNFKPKILLKNEYKNIPVHSLEYKDALLKDNSNTNNESLFNLSNIEKLSFKKNNVEIKTNTNNLKNIKPIPILSNNFQFLLGRKSNKNIFANNNEIIIRKNSKITEKHLELANNYNKLRELIAYSS